jgi:site-specific recombinase XerD
MTALTPLPSSPLPQTEQETAQTPSLIESVIESSLAGLSANTRRAYQSHISRFLTWSSASVLNRETIKSYIRSLELAGQSAQVRNQALAALKKLAAEAGELGCIDPSIASQIQNIKSKKQAGIKTGRWLTAVQLRQLIESVDKETAQGKRDRCVLALLAGAGLRRAEICALTADQVQKIGDSTILSNVVGKGNRIRTVRIPAWCAQITEEWIEALGGAQ